MLPPLTTPVHLDASHIGPSIGTSPASASRESVTPLAPDAPRNTGKSPCGSALLFSRENRISLGLYQESIGYSQGPPQRSRYIGLRSSQPSDLSRDGGNDAGAAPSCVASDAGFAGRDRPAGGGIAAIPEGNLADGPDRAGGDSRPDRAGAGEGGSALARAVAPLAAPQQYALATDVAVPTRPCTCHPSEAPVPCQRKYAFSECVGAAADAEVARIMAMTGEELRADYIARGMAPEKVVAECRAIFERAMATVNAAVPQPPAPQQSARGTVTRP
jgi:hypothetical protein